MAPPGAAVIDARGKWIIPGLMDMHAHVSAVSDFPWGLYVANGVTTVRDPGGNVSVLRLAREEIDSGKTGPRLFFAGYILGRRIPTIASSRKRRSISGPNHSRISLRPPGITGYCTSRIHQEAAVHENVQSGRSPDHYRDRRCRHRKTAGKQHAFDADTPFCFGGTLARPLRTGLNSTC